MEVKFSVSSNPYAILVCLQRIEWGGANHTDKLRIYNIFKVMIDLFCSFTFNALEVYEVYELRQFKGSPGALNAGPVAVLKRKP